MKLVIQLDAKIMVFWDVCSMLDSVQLFLEYGASVFRVYHEDGAEHPSETLQPICHNTWSHIPPPLKSHISYCGFLVVSVFFVPIV
jgi:hypothetical protein